MTLTSDRPASENLREVLGRGDKLFGADKVDLGELRSRAHLYRWAEQEPDVIPLTTADPDFPAAPAIIDAIERYVRAGYFSYGPVARLPEFRESAARRVQERHGVPCAADQIFVTNSAASAIYIATQYIIGPGDEAIVFDPVDFLLRQSVVAAGGVVKRLPLRADRGFSFDPDELENLVVPGRTKLLSICNPHNPLGRVFSASDLQALAHVALKYDLWILSDEVWSDIVYGPSTHVSIAALGCSAPR